MYCRAVRAIYSGSSSERIEFHIKCFRYLVSFAILRCYREKHPGTRIQRISMLTTNAIFKLCVSILLLSSIAIADTNNANCDESFFLRDNDVYVIYGDSITNNSI